MKRILLTSAASMMIAAGPALAGNLQEPIVTAVPTPVPPVMVNTGNDWTGFYAGGSLGFAQAGEDADAFDDDGATLGVHAGYDYDFGSFVLGGEVEFSTFDLADGGNTVDTVARAKLRAGYDAGAFLPYVTLGAAQLDVGGLDLDDTGTFYGVGLDYDLSDNLRLGGEVLQHEFDDFAATGLNLDATTAAVRVSFEF